MVGWKVPVTPIMLLLINVLGDGIPGLHLARESSDIRIMDRKPIGRDESFVNQNLLQVIVRQTTVCSLVVWLAYYLGTFHTFSSAITPSHEMGQSMAFLVLGWTSILHIFTVRSRKSLFKIPLNENPALTISALVMIVVFGLLVLIEPVGAVFGIVPISGYHWISAILISLIPTIIAEMWKLVESYFEEKEHKRRLVRYRRNSEDRL
ncbi:MAG: cation transporting ATPase C-terminal domain-containing protein [Lachnospiraceae bacterium]